MKLTEDKDKMSWVLEKFGNYSTRSMYKLLSHRECVNVRMRVIWKSKLPMKAKFFLWLALQNRNRSHIKSYFLKCTSAKFVWGCPKEALGWERIPSDMQDFLANWVPMGCTNHSLKIFLATTVIWSLWTTRNKMSI